LETLLPVPQPLPLTLVSTSVIVESSLSIILSLVFCELGTRRSSPL
jgi:hypothetical protein